MNDTANSLDESEFRLLIRTLRLGHRFVGGVYNHRELARNMTEIYLDESRFTLGGLREYVQAQLALGTERLDMDELEILEDINSILDKVVMPGQSPRAMTQEELDQELNEIRPV
jgi:hypothetical protein